VKLKLLLAMMVVGACVHTKPVLPPPTVERARLQLMNESARRQRVEGLLTARMPGLQGAVLRADIDVVAMVDGFLFLSVQGFFGAPTHVITTDGRTATIYDGTGPTPVFRRGELSRASLRSLLPVDASPRDAVRVLLAIPPIHADSRVTVLGRDERSWSARVENRDGSAAELELDVGSGRMRRWQAFQADGQAAFVATYSWDGNEPKSFSLVAADRGQAESERTLEFSWKQVTYNGRLAPPETFELVVPPGATVKPLR
jgi:hypothetical protein